MSIDARLRELERHAMGCPECGTGGGRIRLLPIAFDEDGRQAEYELKPCPLCGAEPVRLFPMRLDGDVSLTDDTERPARPAERTVCD